MSRRRASCFHAAGYRKNSAAQLPLYRRALVVPPRPANEFSEITPQQNREVLCDVFQCFWLTVRQFTDQQTEIGLVVFHQLNVSPIRFFVPYKHPKHRRSITCRLNEVVDISNDLIPLRIVGGAHGNIRPELGFQVEEKLTVIGAHIDFRCPFDGSRLLARKTQLALFEFCILTRLHASYWDGAGTDGQRIGRGRDWSSNGNVSAGFRRRALLSKCPHHLFGY